MVSSTSRGPKVLTLAVQRELKGFAKFTGAAAGGGNPGAGNSQVAKIGHSYLALEDETGTFVPQPSLKIGQQRRASHLANPQPFPSTHPMDLTLDLEQLVDPTDRFQRNGRDRRRRPSTARVLGDIGQFEERPPAVRPAARRTGERRPAAQSAKKTVSCSPWRWMSKRSVEPSPSGTATSV